MPELPEVETTLRGISKRIINKKIESFKSRTEKLRWPIDCLLYTSPSPRDGDESRMPSSA